MMTKKISGFDFRFLAILTDEHHAKILVIHITTCNHENK